MVSQIPQAFINELLARCDIVQLIDARVPLKKKGKNYIACCPFHNEKTPSFTVTPEKQFFYCFGCAAGGNALSFLMDYERLSFLEAIACLADQVGQAIPTLPNQIVPVSMPSFSLYSLLEKVTHYYQKQLRNTPKAISYLQQRGLSGQLAKQFSLGYASDGWNHLMQQFNDKEKLLATGLLVKKNEGYGEYDRFRNRIMFPIKDKRGRVIGFGGRVLDQNEPKYLNSPETVIFHKSKELYGLYEVCQVNRQVDYIFVVEGYMDVLALFQAELPFAVATLGTAVSRDQILRLFSVTQEIIFCFDGDEAGKKAALRVLEISLDLIQDGISLRFLQLPFGEDPDSYIRKFGRDAFKKLVEQANYLGDFLFDYLLAQVDIQKLEGKARLVKLAVPLLEKINLGILQHKLFERLGLLVNMDSATLQKITRHKTVPKRELYKSPSNTIIRYSPMRRLIALLIQYPKLAKTVTAQQLSQLKAMTLPGSDLLVQLLFFLKSSPELTGAMLLEYWREDEVNFKILQQLLAYPLTISSLDLEKEFQDRLQHLKKLALQQSIDKLMQEAKQSTLTEKEKKKLYQLIVHSHSDS